MAVRENALFKRLLGAAPRLIALGFVFVLVFIVEELFRRVLNANSLDLHYVEPNAILAAERLALIGQLYTDPHALPFVVLQYGPLFPYGTLAVLRTLHLGTSLASFYFAARLTACLSVVAVMIGVGAILGTVSSRQAVTGNHCVIARMSGDVSVGLCGATGLRCTLPSSSGQCLPSIAS